MELPQERTLDGASGSVEVQHEDGRSVYIWKSTRYGDSTVLATFDPEARRLTVFPRRHRQSDETFDRQYNHITEIQLDNHEFDDDLYAGTGIDIYVGANDEVQLASIPDGFSSTFAYGLGVVRAYRGLLHKVETITALTKVRFVVDGPEGEVEDTYVLHYSRFHDYKAAVDRNRDRAGTVIARVNKVDAHNILTPITGEPTREAILGRHPVIQGLTRELTGQPAYQAGERALLVSQTRAESRAAAEEAPGEFGQLRNEIELVSLEVLIDQFETGLQGPRTKDEGYWQRFFFNNPFALQQLFAAPIAVYGQLLHVRSANLQGQGARIADFVLANTTTNTAFVVELKTPGTALVGARYRGNGGAEVHPPSTDVSGAVAQLQAQIESVREEVPALISRTPRALPLATWSVRGAVIVGNTSTLDHEQRASFVRYRDGLSNIEVIAFDEVRDRLTILRDVLKETTSGLTDCDDEPSADT